MGKFTKDTTITFVTKVLVFILGTGSSVVIARLLGPQGKGVYNLALLLPNLVVTFSSFGVGAASVYHIGQKKHKRKTILGNNIIIGLVISLLALAGALVAGIYLKDTFFGGVPLQLLLLALLIIPARLYTSYFRYFLLGLQRLKQYNLLGVARKIIALTFLGILFTILNVGVLEAIISYTIATTLSLIIGLYLVLSVIGKPDFEIKPSYVKDVLTYGLKSHLGEVVSYLNYRFDIILVSFFLTPSAVGLYVLGVKIAEKLWMVARSASTVLFPRISSEKDEQKKKRFTPIVSRNVFLITLIGAALLFFIAEKVIVFVYSDAYIQSVRVLQILLPGIVSLSVTKVLANDLAGRGKPIINSYLGILTLVINIGLNVLWIPNFGINGAAMASAVSYTTNLFIKTGIYCSISGNTVGKVLIPRREDLVLYRKYFLSIYKKFGFLDI